MSGDAYLDSDAVFGVESPLVVSFERHEPGSGPDRSPVNVPFYTCEYGFRLARA